MIPDCVFYLQGLAFPLEYRHNIDMKLAECTFTFYYEKRDEFDCVLVWIDPSHPGYFLLRTDGETIWYGDFDVKMEKIEKEIDGIVYHGEKSLPTEWYKLDVKNPLAKRQLIEIIGYLIGWNNAL